MEVNSLLRLEQIAETEFSLITKFYDEEQERYIVLKETKGNLDRYTSLLFEREVGALRRLRHNHIIEMYDFGFLPGENGGKKGRIFLEYISGENLQTVDRSLIEYSDKIRIILQLIDAVEAAHSKAILHRDIKPSNIMIVDHRQAKLIDFGLSKIKGMVTGETTYKFGSNHYSAPEVGYHPENASFQSDIYSLGASIYFLLTGCVPDLPEKLQISISQSSDITPPLKNILIKAVESDLEARYETITDLKRDLAQIIGDLMSVTKFSIKFPFDLLEQAKRQKFVPKNVKLSEFIDQYLNKWFDKDIYGFVESRIKSGRLEDGDEVSFFSTNGYLLKGLYKEYDEYFLLNDIKFLKQTDRSRYEKKYLRIEGKPIFSHSINQATEMDFQTYEVVSDLVDHRIEYQSDASKQNEFEKFFGIWTDYLENEKELLVSAAKSLDYMSYSYNTEDHTMEFELQDSTVESFGFTNETTIIFDPKLDDPDRKYRTKPVTIGKFKEITYQDETVYLVVESPKKINGIPRSGKLVEDYRLKTKLIDKQMSAIRALNNDEAICNENLRDIILGFETPKSIGSFNHIDFFNKRLDANQKESVKVALNTSSIAVIQGPPGTGKTTVIREFVNQILHRNNADISQENFKILIVSQSHTAVDNVLEGLNFPQDFNTKAVRIGQDENILPVIRDKYSVSNVRNIWSKETKDASNRKMIDLTTQYGIDPDELKRYVDMYSQTSRSEEEELLIQQFESRYQNEPEKQRIIRTAIIQDNWVKRLGIASDSESRLIENATIVAGTCTGFNSNPSTRNMNFDYVIVDEGAKASVPELLIPLLKGSRLILVGDHQQLPPVLNTDAIKLTSHGNGKQEDFENGMFKRLYDNFPKSNRIRLTTQYRMHQTIGNMISRVFYGNEIQTGIPDDERTHELKLYQGKQLIWVSTSKEWNRREIRHKSPQNKNTYKNEKEMQVIKQMLWEFDKEEASREYEIAVITGYSYQKSIIREFVARAEFRNIRNIEVNTVDAYQGKDKDIVIFSTVRSNKNNDIGFQKSAQRINVALSRARRLLVIVGDKDHFMLNRQPTNKLPEIERYMSQTDGCEIIEYKEPSHARK